MKKALNYLDDLQEHYLLLVVAVLLVIVTLGLFSFTITTESGKSISFDSPFENPFD